jgi:TonB family protein
MRNSTLVAFGLLSALLLPSRAAETAVEMGPGITPPKLQSSNSVRYPAHARPAKGAVALRLLIDRKGSVQETEVVSSPDERLSKAFRRAVTDWRYTPATRDGDPVAVWWTETFQFMPPEEEIATILACDPTKVDAGKAGMPGTSEEVVLPVIVRDAQPVVTGAISARGRSGRVTLECLIDVCGRVGNCRPLKSSGAEYTASAIAAVEKRLYRPATSAGKPIAIYFRIDVEFRM